MKKQQQAEKNKNDRVVLGYNIDDPKQNTELEKHVYSEMAKGKRLHNILNVSDEMLENLYSLAYAKYERGLYEDAIHLFRFLVTMDGTVYKYTLGLAAALQMSKQYGAARNVYTMASLLNSRDPVPYYYAGECYLEEKDPTCALVSWELAIRNAGNDKKYSLLKERALLAKENLQNKIIKENGKKKGKK